MQIELTFPVRVVVYPAGDIRETWIAHALDFDLVSQGSSVDMASAMLEAALGEMVEFRIFHGMSPVEMRPAPEEVWELADAAIGGRLPRDPVPVWIRAGKSDAPQAPEAQQTTKRREPSSSSRPTTYVSQRSPAAPHASAV